MINADEARKIAKELIGAKVQAQLEDVEKLVTDTAEKGEFYCQIEGYLLPQVTAYLKGLGYNIKHNTARNESWTTISWSDEYSC